MSKIAYFECGHPHDNVIDQFDLKIDKIPICNVQRANLMKYDIVIIPSYSNQDVLSKIKMRLEKFVNYGGIVIVLAARDDKTKWIPYCTYHKRFLNTVKFKNTDSKEAKKIFENLSLDMNTFRFHDVFITHGYFTCNEDICLPLITGNGQDLAMAIIQPKGAAGKFLITTLDPDYHAIIGFTRERMDYNNNAQALFQNMIHWAIEESTNQIVAIRKIRVLLGISRSSLASIFLLTSISVCIVSIFVFLFGLISLNTFGVIASISSILSFILNIWRMRL